VVKSAKVAGNAHRYMMYLTLILPPTARVHDHFLMVHDEVVLSCRAVWIKTDAKKSRQSLVDATVLSTLTGH
jgi:hypothetical protein